MNNYQENQKNELNPFSFGDQPDDKSDQQVEKEEK